MASKSGQGSKLARAIVMRLIFGVVSLLFISLVTFLADEIAPGDLATVRAGEKATLAQVERLREELGLNRPWPVRYVEYITKAVKLDFGTSAIGTQKPIKETLSKAIPMTAKIAFLSVLIAAFFGILLGTTAAVYENRFADRAVLSLSTLGVTIPNYVLLPIMVWIFALNLNYLPTSWAPDGQRVASDIFYLILPVIALSLRPMATLTRLTRASMVDTLRQEYVSLAVAKGVPHSGSDQARFSQRDPSRPHRDWDIVRLLAHWVVRYRAALPNPWCRLRSNLRHHPRRHSDDPRIYARHRCNVYPRQSARRSGSADHRSAYSGVASMSAGTIVRRRVRSSPETCFSGLAWAYIALLVIFAIVGPNIRHAYDADPFAPMLGPNEVNWFGTDQLGRDLFARIAYGARISHYWVLSAGASGDVRDVHRHHQRFAPKWISIPVQRLTDGMFAFPDLLLAIMLVGIFSGKGGVSSQW
ncbi:MAG: ABC transporter permease subunit [Fimbriimonadaceae bacterium]